MDPSVLSWPYIPTFQRLALAIALGLFVGLERERRRKDAGMRTFAFVSILGALGGMMGSPYGFIALGLTGVLVIFLNVDTIRSGEGAELTTSAALLVTSANGLIVGQGETIVPVAIAVTIAALLAWKEPMATFSNALTDAEVRSAILLAILGFVVYPALPEGTVDPWGLIEPRIAWVTVILVAALGFVNYILLKLYGDRGLALTAFLGGLVNSKVMSIELATKSRQVDGHLRDTAYKGIVLTNGSMVLRNAIILAALAPVAGLIGIAPFALMLGGAALFAWRAYQLEAKREGDGSHTSQAVLQELKSPFSITAALQFGVVFLVLQVVSTIALRYMGEAGLYVVALVGGVVSSVSAVASSANLAVRGEITPVVAVVSVLLTSVSSLLMCIPFVARFGKDRVLTWQVTQALGAVAVLGMIGALAPLLW